MRTVFLVACSHPYRGLTCWVGRGNGEGKARWSSLGDVRCTLRVVYPAPDLPSGPRSGLIVATERYRDTSLQQLRAPSQDAAGLSAVLGDAEAGGFTLTQLIDHSSYDLRIGIERYLRSRTIDDVLVVYLSCHGILDRRGRLFLAATDTEKTMLSSTGVASSWLFEQLDECQAAQQVVILDCCFSGAFDSRSKGDAELDLERLLAAGRGRAVLTASRKYEYSFEGESLEGHPRPSVFTAGLIEGLRGAADTSGKGFVSVDDAYDFAYRYVQKQGAQQTPQRWLYGSEGKIWLARNPGGRIVVAAELPEDLGQALQSRFLPIRIGAVEVLADWLSDTDSGKRLTAASQLRGIAGSDQPRIAEVARRILHEADVAPDELILASDTSVAGVAAVSPGLIAPVPGARSRRSAPKQRMPKSGPSAPGGRHRAGRAVGRAGVTEPALEQSEWRPASKTELAMRDALRADDQESYFRILSDTDLLLPVSADALAGLAPLGWGTWSTGGRTHVLAFTSIAALQACVADYTGSARRVDYSELADTWPNLKFWLAVNPGLPIESYLPSWYVAQLARGDPRLPSGVPDKGKLQSS